MSLESAATSRCRRVAQLFEGLDRREHWQGEVRYRAGTGVRVTSAHTGPESGDRVEPAAAEDLGVYR